MQSGDFPQFVPPNLYVSGFATGHQTMVHRASKLSIVREAEREVLTLDDGVVAYGPARAGGYWRLRWMKLGRRRDTTARSRDEALVKGAELAERLNIGTATSQLGAKGVTLVEHYLVLS